MPIPTFVPDRGPKPGFNRGRKLEVKNNPFGDNYGQRIPQGLNNALLKSVQLEWEQLTWDQANALDTFLLALEGVRPFYYALPPDVAPRKWICADFGIMPMKGDLATFQAVLQEIP